MGSKTSRRRERQRLAAVLEKLLLVVFSSTLALAVGEVTLRYLYPLGGPPLIHEFDPRLGHRIEPNLDIVHVWNGRENVTSIRTNEMGLRSPPISPRDQHEYRILFLGDSYTFGYAVAEEDGYPRQLERSLNEAGSGDPHYTVVNAGVSAYGTAQELLQFRSLGPELEPNLVVLGFFMGNDLQDNRCMLLGALRTRVQAPCFELEDRQLRLKSSPVDPAEQPGSRPGIAKRLGSWARNSQIATLVKGRGVQFLTGRPGVVGFLERLGLDLQPGYIPHVVAGWYLAEVVEKGWPLTQELIRSLHEEVTAGGATLAVILIPSRVQVIPELFEVSEIIYPEVPEVQEFLADPTRPQVTMMEFLGSEGIPALDLMPVLRDTGIGGGLYYPTCAHWNEEGHGIAAQAVEAFLQREDLLDHSAAKE